MSVFLDKFTVPAPAKVNLHLEVKNKRPDGFHDIKSVFLKVNFADTLHFELLEGKNDTKLVMEGIKIAIPTEENIIFKAASLFREKTGFSQGLSIRAEKRIPPGGGLGGGSSDAASTLLTLNKLAGSSLTRDALLEAAAVLGSDVPFFVHEAPAAAVTGRGEIIRPIKAPPLFFVLVNPGIHSDTAAAYRLLDERRNFSKETHTEDTEVRRTRREEGIREFWLREFPKGELSGDLYMWKFFNDFLEVFERREKDIYEKIIFKLRELGAGFAGLSGTGAACFGVFTEKECAERAAEVLRGEWEFAEYCETLK